MTTVPKPSDLDLVGGFTCKYDAWNRLTEVKQGETVVAIYEYDELSRRVKKHIDEQSPSGLNGVDVVSTSSTTKGGRNNAESSERPTVIVGWHSFGKSRIKPRPSTSEVRGLRMKTIVPCLLFLFFASCSRTPPDPLTGQWSDAAEDPLGMFLDLRGDRTFSMGDIQNGERFPGLSGTWRTTDGILLLKVITSESCKIKEDQEISFRFQLINEHELELSSPDFDDKRIFKKSP